MVSAVGLSSNTARTEPFSGPCIAGLPSFKLDAGAYQISHQSGDGRVSIARQADNGDRLLAWRPGGQAAALPVLDPCNVLTTEFETTSQGQVVRIKGQLEWAKYEVGLSLATADYCMIETWLDITPTRVVSADENLFADARPEFIYQGPGGAPLTPEPLFYFEPPVPTRLTLWRKDLNQFVYFGDQHILKSTVLYYQDFTALNPYFIASGTAMFKKFTDHHGHEDIVAQPPGSYGTKQEVPFEFGLVIQPLQQALMEKQTLRLSNGLLCLEPGTPSQDETSQVAQRFVHGFHNILTAVEKPSIRFVDWHHATQRLLQELRQRKGEDAYWQQVARNILWASLPFLEYFERFDPGAVQRVSSLVVQDIEGQYNPDYENDRGSRGIFGWYRTRETAAKADIWQGYLWPVFQAAEFANKYGHPRVQEVVRGTPDIMVDTAHSLDYVYDVFVDINTGASVPSIYDIDYGATGLYMAIMLEYHELTGEKRYLTEAEVAARRLISFGLSTGFEMNVAAASAEALWRLYKLTGDQVYRDGLATQLAIILKHTWLFNPRYGRFNGRDIFLLTSCRANLDYANAAEELMIMRYLGRLLAEAADALDPPTCQVIATMLRYKCSTISDGLPVFHRDKSIIHQGQPRHWDTLAMDSYIPMEPFGYCKDHMKLGAIAECIYGVSMLAQAALMQQHPLDNGARLYVEAPHRYDQQCAGKWTFEVIAGLQPVAAGLLDAEVGDYQVCRLPGLDPIALEKGLVQGMLSFMAEPAQVYLVRRSPQTAD